MSGKEKPLAVVQLENCPAGELQCAEGTVVLVCREPAPALAAEKASSLLGWPAEGAAWPASERKGLSSFVWCSCNILHPVWGSTVYEM